MLTFEERVLCANPLQRLGSGLEPDPEPTREFGPVANTTVNGGGREFGIRRRYWCREKMVRYNG